MGRHRDFFAIDSLVPKCIDYPKDIMGLGPRPLFFQTLQTNQDSAYDFFSHFTFNIIMLRHMISREFKALLAVSNYFHRHSSVAPTECVSGGLESCCQNLARKTQFCTHT